MRSDACMLVKRVGKESRRSETSDVGNQVTKTFLSRFFPSFPNRTKTVISKESLTSGAQFVSSPKLGFQESGDCLRSYGESPSGLSSYFLVTFQVSFI